jgi:uncharacterized protein YkwD
MDETAGAAVGRDMRPPLVLLGTFAILAACAPLRPAEACPVARAPSVHAHVVSIGRLRKAEQAQAQPERFAQHNLDRINGYRRAAGLPPLALDAGLSAFALEGTREMIRDHAFHGHIAHASQAERERAGFRSSWAENQGGESRALPDPVKNEEKQIDDILDGMMKEGPGGGHHDNILSKSAKRLGVGIVAQDDGSLSLTNDFSE